jgi:putative inorganic carbon (hco3(-)) transporter
LPLPRLIPPGVLPPSRSLRIAILSYLAHILCEGWIGSSEGFLGIALIAAIIAWRRGELEVPFHPLYLPLALFSAASIVSALFAPRPLDSLMQAREWFPFLAFPLAVALYTNVRGVTRLAVGAFLALAIFQSTLGLAQYVFLGHDALERRITGTTAHVMTFSGILLPLSLLFISTSFSRAGRRSHWIAALLTTTALALSFTRGAWVGWAAGLLVIVAFRRIRLLPWLAPLFLLALTFSPEPIFARLVSSFDLRQTSVLDRIRMAEAGAAMVRDHPLFGVGPGNIKEFYPLYRKADAPRFRIPHLHSNPVQIWAERGILALAAWIALLVVFLRESAARRRQRPESAPWSEGGMAAAVGLAVAGLFEFNFGDTEVVLTMLDVWALTLALGGMAEAVEKGAPARIPEAVPTPV